MDLFTAFGLEPVAPVKKEEKKPAAKKQTKPAAKPAEKEERISISPDITISTGYEEAFSLTEKDFGGKKTITKKELFGVVGNKISIDADMLALKALPGVRNYLVGIKPSFVVEKGEINPSAWWTMKIGGKIFSLGTAESAAVTVEQLKDMVKQNCPLIGDCKFAYSKGTNVILVIPAMPELTAEDKLSFPVKVFSFSRGKREITEEEYASFALSPDNSDEEEDGVNEVVLDKEGIGAFLAHEYPEYDGAKILYNKAAGIVVPVVEPFEEKKEVSSSGKPGEETFPTTAVIKIDLHRYPLTPEMFGGKERVTKKELVKFLSEDFPEYSMDRTKFDYDKELNLIIPMLTGGKRGARLTLSGKEAEEHIQARTGWPFNYIKDDKTFLTMSNDIGLFQYQLGQADGEPASSFQMHLPVIPLLLLWDVFEFFSLVHEEKDSEAYVRVYYSAEKGYFCRVPEQEVRGDAVSYGAVEDPEDAVLVIEIHSHNRYPAFWSDTDNFYEKGYRLYGVIGHLDQPNRDYLFRAGCGGNFIPLEPADIFGENGSYESDDLSRYLQNVHVA